MKVQRKTRVMAKGQWQLQLSIGIPEDGNKVRHDLLETFQPPSVTYARNVADRQ